MNVINWNVKDIVFILKERQRNEFDGNIAVSGDRGNGKSTVINKIFYRFNVFDAWKHQVYNRNDVIHLLQTQKLGLCWDDEAVNSSYKRDFQDKGQQELIKILTAYRDNYNIFASAIPNFFSLDKDLRDLYFLHLHVIERGIAVIHMPLQGRLYSQDRWDAKYNAKVEEKWSKKMQKDPNYKPPYHKLTTFRGYLYFEDLTKLQKDLYKEIKKTKRAQSFGEEEKKEETTPTMIKRKISELLLNGTLTKEGLVQTCLTNNIRYSVVVSHLNNSLRDQNINKTLSEILKENEDKNKNKKVLKDREKIISIIPDV